MIVPRPSPRPSPRGRGRSIRRHLEIPEAAFAGRASAKPELCDGCSFSQGEKVRMRASPFAKKVRCAAAAVRSHLAFALYGRYNSPMSSVVEISAAIDKLDVKEQVELLRILPQHLKISLDDLAWSRLVRLF